MGRYRAVKCTGQRDKQKVKLSVMGVMAMAAASPVIGATAERVAFGKLADGTAIEAVELANADGFRAKPMLAVQLEDPGAGRVIEAFSNAPGVRFHSGDFLDGTTSGKGGLIHRQGDAPCLEPQVLPDAPDQKGFPSAQFDPGQEYHHTIACRFSTNAAR